MWSRLIKPALVIAIVGGLAVLHLWACARLSTIECDRARLLRLTADDEALRGELRREQGRLRNATVIREHAIARELQKPRDVLDVVVDQVPASLWAEMPQAGSETSGDGIQLGQLAEPGAPAPAPPPLALY